MAIKLKLTHELEELLENVSRIRRPVTSGVKMLIDDSDKQAHVEFWSHEACWTHIHANTEVVYLDGKYSGQSVGIADIVSLARTMLDADIQTAGSGWYELIFEPRGA